MPTPSDYGNFQFLPNQNTRGGDFSPTADAPPAPEVSAGAYPNVRNYGFDPINSQFTSRLEFSTEAESTPEILDAQTEQSMASFADLQQHLMTTLDTPGTRVAHPVEQKWRPQSGAQSDESYWP
jgi:hypothetical protein